MAEQKIPHIVPSHNETTELPPELPPPGFEKDEEEKERLVIELVDTALAVALLLDAGSESRNLETARLLFLGLTATLRAAADRVAIYVLESPGELASVDSASHLAYVLNKALSEIKQS